MWGRSKWKAKYPLSLFLDDEEDLIGAVRLDGMGVGDVGIGVSPQFGVFPIGNFFSLGEGDLMRDSIFLIGLIVVLEGVVPLLQFQILGQFKIKSCLFGIDVSIALGLKGALVEGREDGQSFDDELIGELQSIVAKDRLLSHLHVPIVERRGLLVIFFLN